MRNECFTGNKGLQVGQALSDVFRLLSATHADITLFTKSHTLFVSHFKPRWRSVERWLTVVMKSPLLPMDELILCVCLFVHVYICACTSVWCIASDPYSPGVTRDQLCRLIDAKSTSQTKYVGHFRHISAISCTHISTTSDDLMFAVDKLKKNAYKTMFLRKNDSLSKFKQSDTF